jgi:hypothetical protein
LAFVHYLPLLLSESVKVIDEVVNLTVGALYLSKEFITLIAGGGADGGEALIQPQHPVHESYQP